MTNKEIKAELEKQLDTGKIRVIIDTGHRGVKVPVSFMNVGPTVFILAWDYPGIDIEINTRSVKATLRFKGTPFRCTFPIKSIKSIISMNSAQTPAEPAKKKLKDPRDQSAGPGLKIIEKEFPITGLGHKGTLTQLK